MLYRQAKCPVCHCQNAILSHVYKRRFEAFIDASFVWENFAESCESTCDRDRIIGFLLYLDGRVAAQKRLNRPRFGMYVLSIVVVVFCRLPTVMSKWKSSSWISHRYLISVNTKPPRSYFVF